MDLKPRSTTRQLNRFRPAIIACGVSVIGVLMVAWYISRVTDDLAIQAALNNAERVNEAIREVRTLYTSEVVKRVQPHGITATHDYEKRESSIPLPATLTIRLGERLSAASEGNYVRLFSDYPFPWREDGGPQNEFEREALKSLQDNPTQPFYRIKERNGVQTLQYATADVMRTGCVSCHNSHAETPKDNWEEGDVRGALSVAVNVEESTVATASKMRGLLWAFLLLAVTGSVGVVYWITSQIQKAKERGRYELEQKAAQTENEQLLQALQLADNHKRALDEHAIVSIADIKGDIIYVNDNFCQISGYAREELLGQNHHIIKSDAHPPEFFKDMWLTIIRGEVWRGVIKNKAKNGSPYWVQTTIVPFRDGAGRIEKYVAIRTDITAIRAAEENLLQANAELREFNEVVVGRELRMIELKQEINDLMEQQGQVARYDVDSELV